MKKKSVLTQARLKELLAYDPDTGIFRWLKTGPGRRLDLVAGYESNGYIQITIDSKHYYVHRLAWLFTHGYMPENDIDHIDRDKANNRLDNLREVSQTCNNRNTGNPRDNTSGVKGVYWHRQRNKWRAQICINGKKKHLGYYENFDDAVRARHKAEKAVNWAGCDSSSPAYKYLKNNNLL